MKQMKSKLTRLAAVLMSVVLLVSSLVIPAAAAPLLDNSKNDYGIGYEDGMYTVSINARTLLELVRADELSKQALIDAMPPMLYDFLVKRDAASAIALLKDLYETADADTLKQDVPLDILLGDLNVREELLALVDAEKAIALIDTAALIDKIAADASVRLDALFVAGQPLTYLNANPAVLTALVDEMGITEISAIEAYIIGGVAALPAGVTTLQDVIAGGYLDIAAMLADELVAPATLLRVVDLAEILPLLDLTYVAQLSAFRQAIAAVAPRELVKTIDKAQLESLLIRVFDNLLNVVEIKLNDTVIYDGVFDLSAMEYALLCGLPTPEKLAQMGNDGEIARFELCYTVWDDELMDFRPEYTNGFRVILVGDDAAMEDAREVGQKIADVASIRFDWDDDATVFADVTLNLPARLSELYVLALNDSSLSPALREKLFGIGNIVMDDATVQSAIDAINNKLTIAELKELLEAVDSNKYTQKLLNALELYETQVEKIRDRLISVLNVLLENVADNSNLKDLTLSDIYEGNGRFLLETSVAVDFEIPESLPASVSALFEDTTLNHVFSFDVTMEDLYRVQFKDENGDVIYTAFRTEGEDLSHLFALPEIYALGVTAWADGSNTLIADTSTLKLGAADLVLQPWVEDAPIIHTVTFVADGNVVGVVEYELGATSIVEPDVPAKEGYTGAWEDYTLDGDKIVNAIYTPITYTAIFYVDDVYYSEDTFTVDGSDALTAPDVEDREGYGFHWSNLPTQLPAADIEVYGYYVAGVFTANFYVDGELFHSEQFTYGDTLTLDYPELPQKHAYTLVWEDMPDPLPAHDFDVHATYVPTVFVAKFFDGDVLIDTRSYTFETLPLTFMPDAPTVKYYNTAWDLPYLMLLHRNYQLVKTPIDYTITYVDEAGNTIATLPFNVETTELNAPAVPAKAGYTGAWDYTALRDLYAAQSDSLNCTIRPVYTPDEQPPAPTTYTVTFVADGKVIATVTYEEGATSIDAPAVPAKVGYTGAWESYTLDGDVTVNAKYTAIEYTVTFKADGKVVGTAKYTVENTGVKAPAVPAKTGYTGAWEDYTLTTGDKTVNAKYTAIEYTVTFKADGKVVGTAKYTVENKNVKAPAVPAKAGYEGAWESYTLTTGDKTVNAKYTAIEYTVTFKADGKVVGTAKYTVENKNVKAPAVPAKAGYEGAWEAYELTTGDKTVNAKYTAIEYTATFVDAAGEHKVTFTVEGLTAPAVADKPGYTGKWEDYTVGAADMTINAVYTPIEYTVTFKADGKVVATEKYTVENKTVTAPAVPAKAGYDGAWAAYELTEGDVTVEAIYTLTEYTVTFKADGKVVGTAKYTVENKTITEPAVPEKKGYEGAWEAYELTEGDVTVNAVYTEIEGSLLWLWILIAILVLGAAAIVTVVILKKKGVIGGAGNAKLN